MSSRIDRGAASRGLGALPLDVRSARCVLHRTQEHIKGNTAAIGESGLFNPTRFPNAPAVHSQCLIWFPEGRNTEKDSRQSSLQVLR